MSTQSSTSTSTAPNTPHVRRPTFDPLNHAAFFLEDQLQLTASKKGEPQLVLEALTNDGPVRAGLITHIPERPATLGSERLPPSIALSGRIAEYTEVQRGALIGAGVIFKAQPGERKTFYTAFIQEAGIPQVCELLMALRTSTGKACLMGQFTARAIALFQRRYADLKEND